MNKLCFSIMVFTLTLSACNSGSKEVENSANKAEVFQDTVLQKVSQDSAVEKFSSEPGLLKMIRENYLDVMKNDHSFLIIPVVSGCTCSLVSFETADSHLTSFRSGVNAPGYWLLKGEDSTYSSKIAKYYPKDVTLAQPKRSFQEYGLFQSSTFIFEIRNNSEIPRWIAIDH